MLRVEGCVRILGMDACGAEATVVLGVVREAGVEVVCARRMPGRSASEQLLGEVRRCLAETGWRPAEIEAVVVVRGPGSFTGVRVGVSAAKGLAEATGAGLVAVSRLDVLASLVRGAERVWALLDAGRGEMYGGLFERGARVEEGLRSAEEIRAGVRAGDAVVMCERSVRERMGDLAGLREVEMPGAADAMRLAAGRVLRREFVDAAVVDGLYLRRTEAEMLERMRAHGTAVR